MLPKTLPTHGDEALEPLDEEKPINVKVGGAQVVHTECVPAGMQYMALGHLHRFRNMSGGPGPCVYSGSPLAYSFAEAGQKKGVVILDCQPGEAVKYDFIALAGGRDLIRKEFSDIDEAVAWLSDNQEAFVELTIVSDEFIAAEDRKRLYEAHSRITTLIPQTKGAKENQTHAMRAIDLQKSMETLFSQYFQYSRGQEPSQELLELFREVVGKESEA